MEFPSSLVQPSPASPQSSQQSQGASSNNNSARGVTVGKKELLQWAARISGNQKCTRLEDLKDGTILLKIFAKIWPRVVDLKKIKWKPNPKHEFEFKSNWDAIRAAMIELKLPLQVYDRKGIMSARFKPCYTFLVMLYFLQNLSENHDFSVDFAHPIDGKLAAFLQSTASVECLARGGALKLEDIPGVQDLMLGIHDDDFSADGTKYNDAFSDSVQTGDDDIEDSLMAAMMAASKRAGGPSEETYEADRDAILLSSSSSLMQSSTSAITGDSNSNLKRNVDLLPPGTDFLQQQHQQLGVFDDPLGSPKGGFTLDWSSSQQTRPEHTGDFHIRNEPTNTLSTIESSYNPRRRDFEKEMNWEQEVLRSVEVNDRQDSLISQSVQVGNQISNSAQTELSSRRIEKILIRNIKSKREVDDLKRMVEDAYEKIEELEKQLHQAGVQQPHSEDDASTSSNANTPSLTGANPFPGGGSNLIWKNKQNKQKGELLLTKMRFEIESLNRQVQFLRQEKEFTHKAAEQKIAELKAAHENEMLYQRDSHHSQSTSQQLLLFNERMRDQRDFTLELKKLSDEIAFEADRIRQGGIQGEDDDAIEEEILRLRQLRVIQSKQLKAMEESKSALSALVEKLQEKIKQEQEKNIRLHIYYSRQDEEITQFLNSNIKDLETEVEGTDDASSTHSSATSTINLTRKERLLLIRLRRFESELEEANVRHAREVEQLKYELFKAQQQLQQQQQGKTTTGHYVDADLSEFDKEQQIERLQSELNKLRRANRYLRERSVVFDEMNIEKGQPSYNATIIAQTEGEDAESLSGNSTGADAANQTTEQEPTSDLATANGSTVPWTPSPYIGQTEDDMDIHGGGFIALLSQLNETLAPADNDETADTDSQHKPTHHARNELIERLNRAYWKMVGDQCILQQRIKKSRAIILGMHSQLIRLKQRLAKDKTTYEKELQQMRTANKQQLLETSMNFSKEKALLQIKLQLVEEALRQARDEIIEAPSANSRLLDLAFQDDERRFKVLKSKLRKATEEIFSYRLREKLWTQLIECQRKNIETTEMLATCTNYEEAVRINKERESLDHEAASYVQQLQALTQQQHSSMQKTLPAKATEDEVDAMVNEATKLLRTQIEDLTKSLEEATKQRELESEKVRSLEQQVKEVEFELEAEKKLHLSLQEEFSTLVEEKASLLQSLDERNEIEHDHVIRLKAEIDRLKQQLAETQVFSPIVEEVGQLPAVFAQIAQQQQQHQQHQQLDVTSKNSNKDQDPINVHHSAFEVEEKYMHNNQHNTSNHSNCGEEDDDAGNEPNNGYDSDGGLDHQQSHNQNQRSAAAAVGYRNEQHNHFVSANASDNDEEYSRDEDAGISHLSDPYEMPGPDDADSTISAISKLAQHQQQQQQQHPASSTSSTPIKNTDNSVKGSSIHADTNTNSISITPTDEQQQQLNEQSNNAGEGEDIFNASEVLKSLEDIANHVTIIGSASPPFMDPTKPQASTPSSPPQQSALKPLDFETMVAPSPPQSTGIPPEVYFLSGSDGQRTNYRYDNDNSNDYDNLERDL